MADEKIVKIDETEFAAAEQEAKGSVGVYVHELSKPFEFEGKIYEKLTFEWNRLTGADSISIENELQSLGKPVIVPEFSGEYLIRMASRACTEKIGSDMICALPIKDYNKIKGSARSFLLRSE